MPKRTKNPSKAAVSAASARGDAGPGVEDRGKDKKNSQNNQFRR